MMKKTTRKPVSVGQLINKLERNIAIANMRGDSKAAEAFRRMLEQAVNSTQFPKVSA
jgi:hypothetical protein